MKILLTGRPGVGKTWIMKELIKKYNCTKKGKVGLIDYLEGEIIVTGNYDGSTFEGADKLSMAAISSVEELLSNTSYMDVVFDGDRFTNTTMLKHKPIVINIEGDGAWGRKNRGSSQTEQRLKSMATRYNSYPYNYRVENSDRALELITELINGTEKPNNELKDGNGQESLF